MNSIDLTRALAMAPGLGPIGIIAAPALAEKTVIALDASDFIQEFTCSDAGPALLTC